MSALRYSFCQVVLASSMAFRLARTALYFPVSMNFLTFGTAIMVRRPTIMTAIMTSTRVKAARSDERRRCLRVFMVEEIVIGVRTPVRWIGCGGR